MELRIVHYQDESNGSIQCPKCHCGNLHHAKVEIFSREEDGDNVLYTVFTPGTQIPAEKILEDSKNPSSRRQGLKIWLKEQSKKIELFFLPPYSPELNPDEYLNNIIKNKIQSLPQARSQDELNSNVQIILKQLQNDHSKIEKIFDHDKIKYAKVKVKQKNK